MLRYRPVSDNESIRYKPVSCQEANKMKTEATPKEKIFQTASRLFYQNGYRAVGVDTIAAESGIGKMTLYRHFPSKDDLIVAYLKDSDEFFWASFEQITKDAATPREKLLAFFEVFTGLCNDPGLLWVPLSQYLDRIPRNRLSRPPGRYRAQAIRPREIPPAGRRGRREKSRSPRRPALSPDGRCLHGLPHVRREESRFTPCRRRTGADRFCDRIREYKKRWNIPSFFIGDCHFL